MKILYVAAADSIHSYKWINFFVERGHKVAWFSLTPPLKEISLPEDFFYCQSKFSLLALGKLKKLISFFQPDILHSHYVGHNGLIAALTGFRPHIVTAWGSDILISGKNIFKRLCVSYILKKADLITCDADHMKSAIQSFGISKEKIEIIYFGIDTKRFFSAPPEDKLLDILKVKGHPIVISLRSLDAIYDIETLIKAVPKVLNKVPDAKFLICGRGPEEENLKRLAHSLGVNENVIFVGFVPNDMLPAYLNIADVYVSTSLSDAGIAASTAEAMACGLPAIVTDFGENSKWVLDGQNGFLFPLSNADVLAEKLIFVLKNKKWREKAGYLSRKIIVENNDYEKEMLKMEKLYQEVIHKR